MKKITLHQWNTYSLIFGVIIWLIALGLNLSDFSQMPQIKLIIFFGIAIITPLTLRVVGESNSPYPQIYQAAIYFQPLATIMSAIAFVSGRGAIGAFFSLGWGGLTLIMALDGATRLLPKPQFIIEEICLNFGMMYVAISGFWFVGYHVFDGFMGFSDTLVLLTAAHFCFISLGALIIGGLVGRSLTQYRQIYQWSAIGLIISPMLVATGITLTAQTNSVSIIEPIGAIFMAGSFLVISALILVSVQFAVQDKLARLLLIISASMPLLSMGLAIAYPIGNYTDWWSINIDDMLMGHAWINAVIVVGMGLWGWLIIRPKSRIEG